MEKKEQILEFLNMLGNVFDKALKDIKENGHHFDVNSDECKRCEAVNACKEFNDMLKAVNDSDYDKDVKTDLAAFIIFMKKEYLFTDDFDIEEILKSDNDLISGYYKRFESVIDNFNNWDKLVEILDNNQLSLIRKIILDINQKITDLLARIKDNNLKEMNFMLGKLHKPQQEAKKYEDMTKEELIEELKNKHS